MQFKLQILRQLVDYQLQHSALVRDIIDTVWGARPAKHRKGAKKEAPPPAAAGYTKKQLLIEPLGQDRTRRRFWVLDGELKPKINPSHSYSDLGQLFFLCTTTGTHTLSPCQTPCPLTSSTLYSSDLLSAHRVIPRFRTRLCIWKPVEVPLPILRYILDTRRVHEYGRVSQKYTSQAFYRYVLHTTDL
jgi:hypothetical protein